MTRIAPGWLRAPAARAVLDALAPASPRFVGGCVRDALLGAEAADLDLCVVSEPDDTMRLLRAAGLKAVPTGLAHGTVTAVVEGRAFETTTLRRDVAADGRRAVVAFTDDIAEDAARRDFTVNALYAEPDGRVCDPLGEGLADLAARRLRFIGEARNRIAEDYLRILRFFRFSARFAEGFDAAGLAACAALAQGLNRLSRERIGMEFRSLLALPAPWEALRLMQESGVLARALPGASCDALPRLAEAEAGRAPDWIRRLAALRADDPVAALRLSNAEAARLAAIRAIGEAGLAPAQAAQAHGADAARDAALLAGDPPAGLDAELARGAAARFPLSARDLIALGYAPGPDLGAALARLKRDWIAEDFRPDRAALLARLSPTQ